MQTIAKSDQEIAENRRVMLLVKHQIRSRVNGVVRTIAKRPGEFVKQGEKIMELEATDRVRIEGQLDVQYASYVRRGMTVAVEPAVPSAPAASHTGHRQAVTGVAVTAHPDGPLVVSVGADGGALVWDPNLGKKINRPTVPHNLPHPVGVRSVAATPPAAKGHLVVTGADDGKIRIWDVSNRDKLPADPKAELEDAHTSGVQAIAISPDGLPLRHRRRPRRVRVGTGHREEALRPAGGAPRQRHRPELHAAGHARDDLEGRHAEGVETGHGAGRGGADVRPPRRCGRGTRRQPRRGPRPVRSGQRPHRPGGPGEGADRRPDPERQFRRFVLHAGAVRPGHRARPRHARRTSCRRTRS